VCSTQSADAVRTWISRHLPDGPHPSVSRPFNYLKLVVVTTSILGVITFFTVAAPYVWPLLQNRNLWAALSLIAILLFTSGQMFNHIRHTPYASGDSNKGLQIFAGGFQNQFGLETQIIAGICTWSHLSSPRIQIRSDKLMDYRWCPRLRDNHTRSEGPANRRRKAATSCRAIMGRRRISHVQLPAQHLPFQEWRLSVLPAAILGSGQTQHLR
jgi:hypothetical protein